MRSLRLGTVVPMADGTRNEGRAADDAEHAPPRPVDKFRQTAAGAVIAAGLFGLRDALEGRKEREDIPIEDEAPGRRIEPGFDLVFDEERGTVTVILAEPLPDEDPRRLL